jgi:hypothetical protein
MSPENFKPATEDRLVIIISDLVSVPEDSVKIISIDNGDSNFRRRAQNSNGVVVNYEVEVSPGFDGEAVNDAVAILENSSTLADEIMAAPDFTTSFVGFFGVLVVEAPTITTLAPTPSSSVGAEDDRDGATVFTRAPVIIGLVLATVTIGGLVFTVRYVLVRRRNRQRNVYSARPNDKNIELQGKPASHLALSIDERNRTASWPQPLDNPAMRKMVI